MPQTSLAQEVRETGNIPPGRPVLAPWLSLALLGASFGPLIVVHLLQTMTRSHYHYVLLLPVAVYFLLRQRWEEISVLPPPGSRGVVALATFGSWSLLCVATLLWSPWLGMVAALITCLVPLYTLGGTRLVSLLSPAWVMAWFAVPLPLELDDRLTARLRTVATSMSSAVLDQFEILHLRQVNVIELPNKLLFIADACSGINSLFVVLALATFIAAWNRRSLLHGILLLVGGFGLVLAENVARLTAIAVAASRGTDLAEGWRHQVLGMLLFALTALLLASFDQLLMFLLPDRLSFRRGKPEPKQPSRNSGVLASFDVLTSRFVVGAFLVLGALQLWVVSHRQESVTRIFATPIDFPEFTLETLPENLAAFSRKGFRHEHRTEGDPLAERSEVWSFSREGISAIVSLDHPYLEPHDLAFCYHQIGWSVDNRKSTGAAVAEGDSFVETGMERAFHGQALLLYSACDKARKSWVPAPATVFMTIPERLQDRVLRNLALKGSGASASGATPAGSCFQIQVLAHSSKAFSAEQQEQCRDLFRQARDMLYQRYIEKANNRP
jgi:exosortase